MRNRASAEQREADLERFLEACWRDFRSNGSISCNRVRAALTDNRGLSIHPQTYSQMWAWATQPDGPMITLAASEPSTRNLGKSQHLRGWVVRLEVPMAPNCEVVSAPVFEALVAASEHPYIRTEAGVQYLTYRDVLYATPSLGVA